MEINKKALQIEKDCNAFFVTQDLHREFTDSSKLKCMITSSVKYMQSKCKNQMKDGESEWEQLLHLRDMN